MEEDIKNIEEMLEFKEDIIKYHAWVGTKLINSVENLLKRYKELEQENKASKETINILTNKLEKVVDENNISEEEKRVLEAYRNYKEISGSNSLIICNPNTMWSEYFIPISVIQKKIEEVNNSNGYSPVNKIFIEKALNEILEEGRR